MRRATLPHPPFSQKRSLSLDSQQLCRRAAKHRGALRIAEAWRLENVIDRGAGPGIGIVGAHDDPAGAGFGGEMAQRLRGEDDRIVVKLLQIFGRALLQRFDALREGDADRIRARGIGRQIAAAMRRANLQAGEAVERALEDQMRQRERRLERIADRVVEPAIAFEAPLELRRSLRMKKDEHAELFGLGPNRMETRVGELLAIDAAADRDAAQPEGLDAVNQLLDGKFGMLQRDRGEGDEALLMRGTEFGELLVLELDERRRDIALGLVPEGIDAESLDIDALRVHRRDPVFDPREEKLLRAGQR